MVVSTDKGEITDIHTKYMLKFEKKVVITRNIPSLKKNISLNRKTKVTDILIKEWPYCLHSDKDFPMSAITMQ